MTGADQPMEALDRAIADYPRRLAEATARVTAAGEATFTGQDEGALVTVTVSGGGEILTVRATHRALRDNTASELAGRVTAAANAALAKAEAALAGAAGQASADADEEQRFRRFEQRMDATLDKLDRLDKALDRLLD